MTVEPPETSIRRPGRRVGDAQRTVCVELLADAFVRGELSQAEYNARTESCLVAVTDVDLARLTGDLASQASSSRVPSTAVTVGGADSKAVSPLRVLGFEAILIVVACLLGFDAASEMGHWFGFAFQFWVVANLAGVAGVFFLRPSRPS